MNTIKELNFFSSIRVELKRNAELKWYKGIGKSHPIQTECKIFYCGRLISTGKVVKHDSDNDNITLGYTLAMRKAMSNKFFDKDCSKVIWEKFFEEIGKPDKSSY